MARFVGPLVLIACGGQAFAPVAVELEDQSGGAAMVAVRLERRLNPACTANCELGAALRDGGNAFVLLNERRDGGSFRWDSVDVSVGTDMRVTVTPTVGASPPACTAGRVVPATGLTARATVFVVPGTINRSCGFEFR